MTPLTLFASVTTAAALGAAGYAVVTGPPADTHAPVSADGAPAVAQVTVIPDPQTNVMPPLPAASSDEPSSPRPCRPEEGIDRDCTYE
jgi:hypothetical protein